MLRGGPWPQQLKGQICSDAHCVGYVMLMAHLSVTLLLQSSAPTCSWCLCACCARVASFIAGGKGCECMQQTQWSGQSVRDPWALCTEPCALCLCPAVSWCRLLLAILSSGSTSQTSNLRLSETDPSSKSIMQFTESIFHPVLRVWGEQSFLRGVVCSFFLPFSFLPFCFVWFPLPPLTLYDN